MVMRGIFPWQTDWLTVQHNSWTPRLGVRLSFFGGTAEARSSVGRLQSCLIYSVFNTQAPGGTRVWLVWCCCRSSLGTDEAAGLTLVCVAAEISNRIFEKKKKRSIKQSVIIELLLFPKLDINWVQFCNLRFEHVPGRSRGSLQPCRWLSHRKDKMYYYFYESWLRFPWVDGFICHQTLRDPEWHRENSYWEHRPFYLATHHHHQRRDQILKTELKRNKTPSVFWVWVNAALNTPIFSYIHLETPVNEWLNVFSCTHLS